MLYLYLVMKMSSDAQLDGLLMQGNCKLIPQQAVVLPPPTHPHTLTCVRSRDCVALCESVEQADSFWKGEINFLPDQEGYSQAEQNQWYTQIWGKLIFSERKLGKQACHLYLAANLAL